MPLKQAATEDEVEKLQKKYKLLEENNSKLFSKISLH